MGTVHTTTSAFDCPMHIQILLQEAAVHVQSGLQSWMCNLKVTHCVLAR